MSNHRFDVSTEDILQLQILDVLSSKGVPVTREVVLAPGSRIDFVVGDTLGIEVKIQGSPTAIFRQCERYCQSDSIAALILVTNRSMGFPPEIAGKPCYLINLGRSRL